VIHNIVWSGTTGHPRVLAAVWIPLSRATLCISCEAVFRLNEKECPACGSRTHVLLVNWLQERRTT